MTPDELEELRKQFKKINPSSQDELRSWFMNYPELTLVEHAMIMNKSEIRVKTIKRKLRLNSIKIIDFGDEIVRVNHRQQPKLIPPVTPNAIDTWIVDQFKNHGQSINCISKAINQSRTHVRTILKHHKVYTKSFNHNKYRTREWLTEHFINRKLSYRQCGKLAGVSRSTIAAWLSDFNIHSRDAFEAANAILDQTTTKKLGTPSNSSRCTTQIK